MRRPFSLRLLPIFLLGLLTACRPQATPTPAPLASPMPVATTAPAPTSTPTVGDRTLTLWLPPAMDPTQDTPAGKLLQAQLDAFVATHPEASLVVRTKAVGGPGGLLDALTTADAAAPAVLPDLVALPQDLLRQAVQRNLLAEVPPLAGEDWYPFAPALGQVDGRAYGVPFAADAFVLVTPLAEHSTLPRDWETLAAGPSPLAFPAADPRALAVVLFYRAAGGGFFDEQGAIHLDEDALRRTFQFLQTGRDSGTFPHWLTQYDQDGLVWQALLEGRTTRALVWASDPLQPDAPEKTITLPVMPDGTAFTLTSGWLWAVPSQSNGDPALVNALLSHLTTGDFLGPWLRALGYLPPRSSALAGWGTPEEQALAAQIGLRGEARPEEAVVNALGPLLSEATVALLKGQLNAEQATQTVLTALK